MSYAWRTLAGITAALTVAACQPDAQLDDEASAPLASVQASAPSAGDDTPELAEARCDWRCLIALGAVTGELAGLLETFGEVLESMPRPNAFQCLRADDDDWLLRLRCTYWSLKDDADSDDDAKSDERGSSGNTGSTPRGSDPWSTGGSAKDDASSSDRGSADTGTRSSDASPPGLGG